MAAFCKQCSIDMFGKDFGDLAWASLPHYDLCEGCGGYVWVDGQGRCIDRACPIHGEKKNGRNNPGT